MFVSRNIVNILGIPIDAVTRNEAVEIMLEMLGTAEGKQFHVVTANSEMLVEAHRNERFKNVLKSSDLNIPDSAGVVLAARFKGAKLPQRVTGVDTVKDVCSRISGEHPVFLLGAGEGVAEKAGEELVRQNPNLRIAGAFAGSPREEDSAGIIGRINSSGARLLLVAYGAPLQDIWIHKHLSKLASVRVAIGVGGTLDFISGSKKRAPKWMQSAGLEWSYRLVREPRRWRRIVNAVVVFPRLVVFDRSS